VRNILAALAILALPAAAASAGTEPVNVLTRAPATRADAIGGAATALGRDAGLVWLNPAAPAFTTNSSLTLAGQRGFFGEVLGQGLLTSPFTGGVLAFGIMYYDAGTAALYTSDGTPRKLDVQQDFMGSLTWSRAFSPALAVGVTLKGLNSILFGENTSAAFASDAGAQFRINDCLKVGVALRNIGTQLQYHEDRISLPSSFRAGAMLGTWVGKRDALLLTSDAETPLRGGEVTWCAGAEYQWHGMVSLRAGAHILPGTELGRWTAGAGIVFRQYRLDYGVQFGGGFDAPHTLSLTMVFPRFIQSVTVPAVRPAGTLPPPAEMPTPGENELLLPETTPGPGSGGVGDDLNRELDELMKNKK